MNFYYSYNLKKKLDFFHRNNLKKYIFFYKIIKNYHFLFQMLNSFLQRLENSFY